MATKIIVPHLGESIESATLTHWYKDIGDAVSRGEELADLETDKATLSLECPGKGTLLAILVEAGTEVHIGQLLAVVGTPGEDWTEKVPSPEQKEPQTAGASSAIEPAVEESVSRSHRQYTSPLARRRAEALGIDIKQVSPERGNRVKVADVERYLAQLTERPQLITDDVPGHLVPIPSLKRLVGQRMLASVQSTPQFSTTMRVDVRRMLFERENIEINGRPVSITTLLVYFVARSLQEHPLVNSKLDGDHIFAFDTVNIGVAVATPEGLRVPVIHQAESLSLAEIGERLKQIATKARSNDLSAQEVANGTFTISNLGMMGVAQFTPILNPPQAAILGVGAPFAVYAPIRGGGMRLAQYMDLTLTADHRILDGADSAQFLSTLKEKLEACNVS